MKGIKRKIKKAIRMVDKYSPYPFFYSLIMSENEIKIFVQNIKNSEHYLEFGSGGSTFKVLQKSKAKIYSVESSLVWIEDMRKYLLIRFSEKCRLFFYHVEIGKTKKWGFPIENNSRHLFPNYSSNIFNHLDTKKIDTVFIDGRFRVASTLSAILNCFSVNNITILIHDFWNREKYHVVLKYLIEVDRADSLGVFKLKKDIDLELVEQDYEIYKYIDD